MRARMEWCTRSKKQDDLQQHHRVASLVVMNCARGDGRWSNDDA